MPTLSVNSPRFEEESSGNILFLVSLSEASPEGVTVAFRTRSGTATEGEDFGGRSGTLNFDPTDTVIPLSVSDFFDSEAEADESIILELYDPVGADLPDGLPVLQAVGWLQDNDGTGTDLGLQVLDPTLVETDAGTQQMVFTLSLSQAPSSDITLAYTTQDGTAVAGDDYVAASGNVTFTAGQTTALVSVDIVGDMVDEPTEAFDLVVTPTADIGNGAAGAVGTGTILNDDAALPTISVSRADVLEGASADLRFAVTLSEAATGPVTVAYRTNLGSATSGTDFNRVTGTVTFDPGETVQIINISDRFDTLSEADESVVIELFDPAGAVLSGDVPMLRATGWILDDDGTGADLGLQVSSPVLREGDNGQQQMVFEVSLSEPAAGLLSLAYETRDGTAFAGQDYTGSSGTITFQPGQDTAYVTVDITGDAVNEATEGFDLIVTPTAAIGNGSDGAVGTGTILNDDAGMPTISVERTDVLEGATSNNLYFIVTLSEPASDSVTVQFRTELGTAGSDDFFSRTGTIRFDPGETQQIISVVDRPDSTVEFDESVLLELYNPVGAQLSGGLPVIQSTGWLLDDDGAGNAPSLQVSSATQLEGPAGTQRMVFEVSLSQSVNNPITLSYSTSDGTAIAGQDYVAASGSVTFAAGQSTAYVMVDVLGDGVSEISETFNLVLTPTAAIANGAAGAVGVGTIVNFDVDGDNTVTGSNVRDVINVGLGNDVLSGLGGDDELLGGAGDDTVRGDTGNDSILGESGADLLEGGDGDDTIDGGGRNDTILGGNGNDSITGVTGNDEISAGFGNDTVDAGSGNDRLDGGTGEDVLLGGDGRDRVVGRFSNDTVRGGEGDDNIFGGQGDDLMYGDGGNDRMIGQIDNDTMFGGTGNDTMSAGDGDDYLNGNGGDDNLIGGGGADVFAFIGQFGTDRIVDFDVTEDLLNVRNLAGVDSYADLVAHHMQGLTGDRVLINDDNGNRILVFGVTLGQMQDEDLFIF